MRASCRQLNQRIQGAVDTAFYIDRIDIRVDDLSIRNEVQRLLTQADEKGLLHKFTLSPIRAGDKINHTFWKKGNTKGFKISLSRPRIRLLRKLCRPLLSAHYSISWLEISYYIDTPSHDDAIDLVGLVADMVVVPSIANSPTFKDLENNITDAPQGPFTSV